MKEDPISTIGEEISIIIYDSPLPPRYIKLSKKFLRTLFFLAPITLGAIFIALIFYAFLKNIAHTPSNPLPSIQLTSSHGEKLEELKAELLALEESNKALQEKILTAPSPAKPGDLANQESPFLLGIKKPLAMKNLISQKKVLLDQFVFTNSNNKVNLKFQIISLNPELKVMGHVLVFMISEGGLMAYPAESNMMILDGIKFNQGEPFAVSRLRPTNAEFLHDLKGSLVRFIIYIFSREGDLLLVKDTESYEIGEKNP